MSALAQAYSLLEDAGWNGAPLADIINAEVQGFSSRVRVSGCDIRVSAAAAQQFSLIVHELATNAIKYGALSAPDGHVTVEGTTVPLANPCSFCFSWTEHGGPKVAPPQRKGFGTTLLIDAANQFSDEVQLRYDPGGLKYQLRTQLSAIEAERSGPPRPIAQAA